MWQRPCKSPEVRLSAGIISSAQASNFPVEPFLKARNRRIKAQNFHCKTVLRAKFLRPRNPPLPFVPRFGPIRHTPIISSRLWLRNAGNRPLSNEANEIYTALV